MASLAASMRASAGVRPFAGSSSQPRPVVVRVGPSALGKQRCVVVVRAQADGEQ